MSNQKFVSMNCSLVTIKTLVMTNIHTIHPICHNNQIVVSTVEVHTTAPNVKQGIHFLVIIMTIRIMTNLHSSFFWFLWFTWAEFYTSPMAMAYFCAACHSKRNQLVYNNKITHVLLLGSLLTRHKLTTFLWLLLQHWATLGAVKPLGNNVAH